VKLDFRPLRNPDLGLLLIRSIVGIVGIFHGAQKLFGLFGGYGLRGTAGFMREGGFPVPMGSALAIGITEFFGGILIVLGLFMRPAALAFSFGMFVAAIVVHRHAFDLNNDPPGMEYALTLAIVLLGLFLTGSGRFSISGK
jgi:putative oxidoreductase